MDELYTVKDEECIILAYYYGRHKFLNSIALQRITRDLINAFEKHPDNSTTKYSKPVDSCCLCKEKEDIFKDILERYCHSQQATTSTSDVIEKDVNEAWNDIGQLWENARTESANLSQEKGDMNFKKTCKGLLEKHGIKVGPEKSNGRGPVENWLSLNRTVKKKLEACISAMERINGDFLSPVESGPYFTKWSLRNAYLTFLTEKGARTHAKFMQDCRTTGVQIRAARDPISVIAKYMMCGRCFEPLKRHKCTMVMDILGKCLADFNQITKLNAPPDIGARLFDTQVLSISGGCGTNRNPIVVNNPNPMPLNALLKDEAEKKVFLRRSDRAHSSKKKHESFIYYTNGNGIWQDNKSPTEIKKLPLLEKRRVSLPAIPSNAISESSTIQVKVENAATCVTPNENFSVVIVTSQSPSQTSSSAITPSKLKFSKLQDHVHSKSATGRPISVCQDSSTIHPAKKCRILSNLIPTVSSSAKPRKVLFLPPGGFTKSMGAKGTIIPLSTNDTSVNNPNLRSRSISLDGAQIPRVVFQTMKPKLSTVVQRTSSYKNPRKKPFLVQIVNGKGNCNVSSGDNVPSCVKIQSSPVMKKIPLNSSQVKFVKSVSLKNRLSLIKNLTGVGKTSAGQLRASTSKSPQTVLIQKPLIVGNLNQSTVMHMNPLLSSSDSVFQSQHKLHVGRSFTFKTSTLRLSANGIVASNSAPIKQKSVNSTKDVSMTVTPSAESEPKTTTAGFSALKRPSMQQIYSPSKTPSKKKIKPTSKPIPTVVAEYIFSLMPSADKELWKKVQARNKRRCEKSSALIPIPYETNFLCINDTIERYGWKAYWYRKCRCSKIREKAADAETEGMEQNPTDIESWIPKTLPERTTNALLLSLESEDRSTNTISDLPFNVEKLSPNNKVPSDNHKSRLEQESSGVEKLDSVNMTTSEDAERNTVQELGASKCAVGEKGKFDVAEENKRPLALPLKAKYRKDENGNWSALKNDADKLNSVSERGVNHTETNHEDHDDEFEDSVVLNFHSSLNFHQNTSPSMEDCVGTTNDHGLRRCARATMIRRKALIQRALDAEMRPKVKRGKAEFHAAEGFMFISYHDESQIKPTFDVVSAHPVCFRDNPEVFIQVSTLQENKAKALRAICVNENKEQPDLERRRNSEEFYSFLCQLPSQNLPKKTEKIAKKLKKTNSKDSSRSIPYSFKSCLVDELESMWGKKGTLSVKNLNFSSSHDQKVKNFNGVTVVPEPNVIGQIVPEVAVYNLQVLRGIPASNLPTCVISHENAKFITSAVRTAKDVLATGNPKAINLASSTIDKNTSLDVCESTHATAARKGPIRLNCSVKADAPSSHPRNNDNFRAKKLESAQIAMSYFEQSGLKNTCRVSVKNEIFPPTVILSSDKFVKSEGKALIKTVRKADLTGDHNLNSEDSNAFTKHKNDVPRKDGGGDGSVYLCDENMCKIIGKHSTLVSSSGLLQKENVHPHYVLKELSSSINVPPSMPAFGTIYNELKKMINISKSGILPRRTRSLTDCVVNTLIHSQLGKRLKKKKRLSSFLSPKYNARRLANSVRRSCTGSTGSKRIRSKGRCVPKCSETPLNEVSVQETDHNQEMVTFQGRSFMKENFGISEGASDGVAVTFFRQKASMESYCGSSPELVRGSTFLKSPVLLSPNVLSGNSECLIPTDPKFYSSTPVDRGNHSDIHLIYRSAHDQQEEGSLSESFTKQKRRRHLSSDALDRMNWFNSIDFKHQDRRMQIDSAETTPSKNINFNKRKKHGHGYSSSASNHTSGLLEADKSSLEEYSEKESATADGPLHQLLSRSLNFERVRTWMWDSTSAKSFQLCKRWEAFRHKRLERVKRRHSAGSSQSHTDVLEACSQKDFRREGNVGGEKQYFSDGDERNKKSFIHGSSNFASLRMRRACKPLMPHSVVSKNRSPVTVYPSRELEEESTAVLSLGTKLHLLKHCAQESPRPKGLSKSRRSGFKRKLDFSKIIPTQDATVEQVHTDNKGSTFPPNDSNESSSPQRRVRSSRLKCVSKRDDGVHYVAMNTGGQCNNECSRIGGIPSSGKRHKGQLSWNEVEKTDIQTLRQTIFAELKTKRRFGSNDPSEDRAYGQTDCKRPLLQSRCSTKGCFISRLIECDALSADTVH